jgi:hypothetical protein
VPSFFSLARICCSYQAILPFPSQAERTLTQNTRSPPPPASARPRWRATTGGRAGGLERWPPLAVAPSGTRRVRRAGRARPSGGQAGPLEPQLRERAAARRAPLEPHVASGAHDGTRRRCGRAGPSRRRDLGARRGEGDEEEMRLGRGKIGITLKDISD